VCWGSVFIDLLSLERAVQEIKRTFCRYCHVLCYRVIQKILESTVYAVCIGVLNDALWLHLSLSLLLHLQFLLC
jgi:hypothetical protein